MNVLKAAAMLPRRLSVMGNNSFTIIMTLVVSLLGATAWLLLDLAYQRSMERAVNQEWTTQLQLDAKRERSQLRNAFSAFSNTARYLSAYGPLQQQLQIWNASSRGAALPELSRWKPLWLPGVASVDGLVPIDYALVMGMEQQVYAIYQNGKQAIPTQIAEPGRDLLHAAAQAASLTLVDGVPYLMASAAIKDAGGRAQGSALLASRIDQRLLTRILGQGSNRTLSALLLGGEKSIVATSSAHMNGPLSDIDSLTSDGFELVSSELLLESDGGPELRHLVWYDGRGEEGIGELFLFSVRQQRTLAVLVFAALLGLAIVWISRRVEKIHDTVDHYAQLLGIHLPRLKGGDQIERLGKRLERLSEEVLAETFALQYQAQHDQLTSLPNRSLLLTRLEAELQTAQEEGEALALFIMDLDQFKEVNDTLGHDIGDRLLREVGRRLVSVLRRTDTVSRLGGDEFAVLLPGADYEHSKTVCRKILAAIERPIKIEDYSLRAGISIGVALCPDHGQDANLLLKHADVAMYQAKRKQRGFVFYTAEQDDHSINRLGLSAELKEAIDQEQLMLEYQPMADIKSGRIFCAEALVRWRHPELGLVPPEEFVPTAEQTGVIRPLTLWVIDKALAQASKWHRIGIDLCISVNLSVRSLQDRKLPQQVERLLDKHHTDPRNVILEITESALMSDPITARRVMRRLSNMGFQLSIDDFGTGYSSLSYLKQLPVDEIKIDRSFVTQMDEDENDAVIVRATIDLAHNLGLKVVAEGVETTDVWDLLEMLGCDIAQGYFIRRPLAAEDLASWIHSEACGKAHWGAPLHRAR